MSDYSHAECSPSQLKRIILCPGSRILKRINYTVEDSSPYALEGQRLHSEAQSCIIDKFKNNLRPIEPLDTSLVDYCLGYLDSVVSELRMTSSIKYMEPEGYTSLAEWGLPEVSGHADVIIVSEGRLDIIDWKFGAGIAVVSKNNYQLMAYAAGALPREDIVKLKQVWLHVVQPRRDYCKPWKLTGKDLEWWVEEVLKPQVILSRDYNNAECSPGKEQCRWCVNCKAKVEHTQQTVKEILDFKPEDFALAGSEELMAMVNNAKTVSTFIKQAEAEIFKRATSVGVPGYKVVAGRSSRVWKDPDAARQWLYEQTTKNDVAFDLEDLYDVKFLSVAAIEKLSKDLKKDPEFQSLWHKVSTKLLVVPEEDEREAIGSVASSVFADYAEVKS